MAPTAPLSIFKAPSGLDFKTGCLLRAYCGEPPEAEKLLAKPGVTGAFRTSLEGIVKELKSAGG